MKIYIQPDTQSKGITRVSDALAQYMPYKTDIVADPKDADIEVIHVTGRRDKVQDRVNKIRRQGRKYAIIQYVLKSSKNPDCHDWMDIWDGAEVVWSYYNLIDLCDKDGIGGVGFNFYYAPLGVDLDVFNNKEYKHREYVVGATSQHALSESVRECAFATKEVNKRMFFIGHELRRGEDIVCRNNLSDQQVADVWNQCLFVSGLRRIEGFEFPVIEGLACGAIPIVFDRPEMKHWFDGMAVFIPEGNRDDVIKSLTSIFYVDNMVIHHDYIKQTLQERFNWETIIKSFLKRIL